MFDQHQEVLAARDVEAMRLMIEDGDVEQFVKHGLERIAANMPEQADKDRWTALFLGAVSKAEKTQAKEAWAAEDRQLKRTADAVTAEVRAFQAELEAGERAGVDYIKYLSERMAAFKPGSIERSLYSQAYAEAKKWIDSTNRAMEKRLDQEIAAAVANNEMTLEAALSSYEERRKKVAPGDEAYGVLTKQIAEIKNGIESRDTNKILQQAHAKLVDAKDPAAGRKEYLGTLVGLMNRARTAEAQKSLFEQITKVKEAISKDETIKAAQETNDLIVRYYDPTQKVNVTEVYQHLAKKALEARTPEEGARYENLAQQVASHERQKAQDALAAQRRAAGGAGGPGFTTEQVNVALGPFEDAYKDARVVIEQKIDRGLTPTQADWAILKETRERYLDVIGQAFTQGNAAAKRSMQNTERDVKKASGAGAGFDFGDLGEKMSAKIVSDAQKMWAPLERAAGAKDDPELALQAIAKFHFDMQKNASSPFLTETGRGQILELDAKAMDKVALKVRDSLDTMFGEKSGLAIAKISSLYDKYADAARERGQTPKDFGTWMQMMGAAEDTRSLSSAETGLGVKVDPSDLRNFRVWSQQDDAEQREAVDQLVMATAARRSDGTVDPNWLPGGRLDESTRALFRQGTLEGMSTLPLNGGRPVDDLVSGMAGGPFARGRSGTPAQSMFVQPEEWGSQFAGGPQVPGLMAPPAPGGGMTPGGDMMDAGGAMAGGGDPMALWSQLFETMNREPQPGERDFFDESERIARRARFEADPYGSAWDYLTADVEMQWPTIVVPEMPPQSPFYKPERDPWITGPTLNDDDYGGPGLSFNVDWNSFSTETAPVGEPDTARDTGSEPGLGGPNLTQ